jgi:hydrogenase maturation factor
MDIPETAKIQPALDECCAEIPQADPCAKGRSVCAQAQSCGDAICTPVFAMAEAFNALCAKGAKPEGLLFSYDVPTQMEEDTLKEILAEAARAGKEQKLPILNIQVQTSPFLTHMNVHVTAVGYADSLSEPEKTAGSMDLVICQGVGLAGSLQILAEKEPELRERFQPRFLQGLREKQSQIFAAEAIQMALEAGARIVQTGQSGVFGALWNLGETLETGMELDLKRFPILQETIEICEQYDVNPYVLTSAGTMIFAVQEGERLAEDLCLKGYQAAVIGHTIRGKERILHNGEDIRYLDRPMTDEIWKIF